MPPQQYPAPESRGDLPAWEELRKRAVDILRRVAWGWEPTDWEDMAQEAILKTIVALAKDDQVDRQQFAPWFYTVVVHVARDWHHRYGREVPLPEAYEREDVRVKVEIEQLLAGHDVEVLLPALEPQERLVLKLSYYHNLTSREIAKILGERSADTVRSWISRALQKLRGSLRRT